MTDRTERLTSEQVGTILDLFETHCPACGHLDWICSLNQDGVVLLTCENCDRTVHVPAKEIDRILGASL